MTIDQGNTYLCASYCFAYALHDYYGILLDVNWLPAMRASYNATLDGHLNVLQTYGALPMGEYSVEPCLARDLAQAWLAPQKTKLIRAAEPYKVAEWRCISAVDDLYALLQNGWYGVFIASQYRKEKFRSGYYLPYDGEEYAGTHAMSVWLRDGKLWVQNTRGENWGTNGGAYIRDADVIKGGQCYAFRLEGKKDDMRTSKYVSGLAGKNQLVVRETADPASAKVGHLGNGESVTVIGEKNGRSLVSTGTVGWVSNAYLSDNSSSTKTDELPPEPEDQNAKLQWYLHKWGFGPLVGEIDGVIGTKTKAATKQFQAAMGLAADGIAGTKTWAALTGDVIIPRITENDMACQCGKYCDGYPNPCATGVRILIERIWRELEEVYPGVTLYITNNAHPAPDGAVAGGQRCEDWNRLRGGANGSKHKDGMAADIYGKVYGVDDAVVRQAIEDIAMRLNTKGGVGYGARYIVHVDIRGKEARWKY